MALPTFDFVNIVRIALSKALVAVKSPLVLLLAFAVVFGTVGTTLYNIFSDYTIPQITEAQLDFSMVHSELLQLILYASNSKQLVNIVNTFITTLNVLIPFTVTFFATFFAGLWAYNVGLATRTTTKDTTAL